MGTENMSLNNLSTDLCFYYAFCLRKQKAICVICVIFEVISAIGHNSKWIRRKKMVGKKNYDINCHSEGNS